METVGVVGALAVAFAALGILATAVFRLDAGIDDQGRGIDALGHRLDTKVEGLGAALGARFDEHGRSIGNKVDGLAARMNLRFDRVDERLSAVEIALARHLEWHQAAEG